MNMIRSTRRQLLLAMSRLRQDLRRHMERKGAVGQTSPWPLITTRLPDVVALHLHTPDPSTPAQHHLAKRSK